MAAPERFPGFTAHDLPVPGGTVHVVVGGAGPPVLLLHGYPQSHLMWHAVAPQLAAAGLTVVVADLPGYGASTPPPAAEDHLPHAKRTWAQTLVAVMGALGHDRFAVLGHDRGARVAYRMALDHPGVVTRLAVLDVVPTLEVWERADATFALAYWHWGLLAQPAPLPEGLILDAPGAYWEHHVRRMGIGGRPGRYPEDVLQAYRATFADPARVASICQDHRAGAACDREHDRADREPGRTIACPTLALWGAEGALPLLYDDPLAIWRAWAPQVTGHVVQATHFLVEDLPEQVGAQLTAFAAAG